MATTYLTRAQVAGNRQTFTQSFWVKLSNTTDQGLISSFNDSTSYSYCYIDSSTQQLQLQWKSGSVVAQLNTNRKFRDTSGWYNIIYAVDTTQSTDSDRIKLYINGVQETSFSTATYPGQILSEVNDNGTTQYIGSVDGTQQYVNGSMSYVAQIDGTQELPGIFGETDSTTGEWKIKTTITPSVAWGNNGFLILKNGNSLTDESTNSNNFTLGGGTLTNTKDCPDNVFCTMNPLDNYYANSVFSNGNTTVVTNAGNYTYNTSTIGINVGMKAYWEAKYNTTQSGNGNIGVIDTPSTSTSAGIYQATNGISVDDLGKIYKNNSDTGITLGTLSTSDVICFAYDNVNGGLYVRKNGDAWINSGVPTSGASKTGIISPTTTGLTMFPAVGDASGSSAVGSSTNFGNGVFGTTAVSSAGTNASNNGVFEYDVPTGYTALSTKGLNL